MQNAMSHGEYRATTSSAHGGRGDAAGGLRVDFRAGMVGQLQL
jgi:hypothetical protein